MSTSLSLETDETSVAVRMEGETEGPSIRNYTA